MMTTRTGVHMTDADWACVTMLAGAAIAAGGTVAGIAGVEAAGFVVVAAGVAGFFAVLGGFCPHHHH